MPIHSKKIKGKKMTTINSVSNFKAQKVNFKQSAEEIKPEAKITETKIEKDSTDFSSKSTKEIEPPQISRTRLFFCALTDEQVSKINESKKLPENGKFVMNGYGQYYISPNLFGLRPGTQELPAGFEVKKNILGFAVVVPKGTKGYMLRD